MQSWHLDWAQAARGLRRWPASATAAVLSLTLGIGACATALRLVDRLYVQPPAHVAASRSLVRLYFSRTLSGLGEVTSESTSYPAYLDLRRNVGGLGALGAFAALELPLGQGPQARRVRVQAVTGRYFHLLGVQPLRGRLFAPDEGEAARPSAAVLVSADFWRRELAASPGALGGPLRLGGTLYTVVGILPSRFTGVDLDPVDAWVPLAAVGESLGGAGWGSRYGSSFLSLVARLPPGLSQDRVEAEGSLVYRRLTREEGSPIPVLVSFWPRSNGRGDRTAPQPHGSHSP